MSKYLVTGGAGLVGSHIVDALIERGEEVIVYDNLVRGKLENINPKARFIKGDIVHLGELTAAMSGVDGVFHQAALCLKDCEEDPYAAVNVNITGTLNVLEACKRQGVKKIVGASSSSVYGDGRYLPTDEVHPFDNYLFYGASKVANEQFYRAYYKKYGINYIAFRYLNVYGPRMDTKGAYMMVIMHFLNKLKKNERPVIYGDGTATLDLVYVKDVAQANIMAMDSAITDECMNVATGKPTSLKKLLDELQEVMGTDLKPIYEKRDDTLVTHRLGCPRKLRRLLNFKCSTKLSKGLKEIYDQQN